MKKNNYKFIVLPVVALTISTISLPLISRNPTILKAEEIGSYDDTPRLQSMSFYGNTTTQMGFCWTTTNITSTNLQVLEKSVYEDSNGFDDESVVDFIKYYEGTIEKSLIAGDGFIHRAVAKKLKSDTEYVYRFGDEELNIWCDVGSFKTSAKNNRNFSFLHISDPQGDNELHYQSYNQLLSDADARFNPEWIALTGDITDDSHFGKGVDLHEWELALTEQWSILKNYPVMAVSGNHDGALHAFHSRYNNNVMENSDVTTGEYYSFDYQGVHFTCLNSNDTSDPKDPNTTGLSEAQLEWCEADLAAHQDDKFLIIMMHKGLFDSGGHSCNFDFADYDIEQMRRQLTPLFTKYGVDLVLEGHDHLYNLSYPMVADTYVGQENYYHIDEGYKYSIRDYGEFKDVYTFSNLKGTFYFNTGTASGQKYYAPVIGGSMEDTIFSTSNPNQKMYTMVDILDSSILLRTYVCTSNQTYLYKIYAIANDDEGTPSHESSEYDTDFEVEGDYSFTYDFLRYDYSASVNMASKKLINAEADLAAKFVGNFTSSGGNGTSICRLFRNGNVTMNTSLEFDNEIINFYTEGSWHMNENKELIISIKNEKDTLVEHVAKMKNMESNEFPLWATLLLAIGVPAIVIGVGLVVVLIVNKKKKKVD